MTLLMLSRELEGGYGVQALFFTSASGWILVVLAATTIALPFLLRRNSLSVALGLVDTDGTPYLLRMWPHYWLGYLIMGITLAHALVPMAAGLAEAANAVGLYLATGALSLLIGQMLLGRRLRQQRVSGRRTMRRWRFWGMVGIVALGVGHIALNSPTLQTLFR
jgi:hypothetical protein